MSVNIYTARLRLEDGIMPFFTPNDNPSAEAIAAVAPYFRAIVIDTTYLPTYLPTWNSA
jgi:hypothetical protein